MSKPKKMGRPKLPKAEVRKVFPLRISDAERASYEKAAKSAGIATPAWMRGTLNGKTKLGGF